MNQAKRVNGSEQSNASSKHTGVNSRSGRSRTAHQTLEILKEGVYVNGYDRAVHIKKDMEQAVQQSVLYRPSELTGLGEKARAGSQVSSSGNLQNSISTGSQGKTARIEVTGETTLAAAAG